MTKTQEIERRIILKRQLIDLTEVEMRELEKQIKPVDGAIFEVSDEKQTIMR